MPLLGSLLLAGALNNGYPFNRGHRTVTRTKTVVVNRSNGRPVRMVTKRTTTSRPRGSPFYLNSGFFRY